MGQNRITQTRSAPLIMHDATSGVLVKRIIEGITNVSVPGPSSPRFPAGDVLDRVRKYAVDLPEPGVASFQLNFNGADPLHRRLYNFQKDHKTLKFEWRTQGKIVNGVKSAKVTTIGTANATLAGRPVIAAAEFGKLSAESKKEVGNEQKLTLNTFSNDEPRVGDILTKGNNHFMVDRANYEDPAAGITLVVKAVTISNDKAISVTETTAPEVVAVPAADYIIYEPSVSQVFIGEIAGIPSGGGQYVVAGVSVNISDEIQFIVLGP